MAEDEVTAALAEIRAVLDGNNDGEWYEAGRRMLAAVDKALKLAATWEADAAGLDRDVTSARQSPYPGDHHLADTDQALAAQYRECASDLRGELLAALKGENDHG